MKIFSLISVAAVIIAASLTFLVGNSAFYSVVPCILLLLIAAGDYGPKVRYRRARLSHGIENLNTRPSTVQPYRLAA